jgi:hypothetical protein
MLKETKEISLILDYAFCEWLAIFKAVPGVEAKASSVLGKGSTIELHC